MRRLVLSLRREMSLEECLEYIKGDEYVEVTPKNIRMRKITLIIWSVNARIRIKSYFNHKSGGDCPHRAAASFRMWVDVILMIHKGCRNIFTRLVSI